jgi:beta-fructofuranosidase
MLRLEDHWVWDSWVADDGERFHLFFLKAPRALADPSLRHARATVGHAVSTDLRDWEVLADALGPEPGGWDDLAIWTGSVVRGDDGRWRMFYTAINTRGHELRDQRIGVVESDDLIAWGRTGPKPTLSVDTRWYESLAEDTGASETWRDPFVVPDDAGDGWHMLICARARDAARLDDGVIAHAWSPDLRRWQATEPVCAPGAGFGQLEVAQVRVIDGQHVLVFTCHPEEQSAARREEYGDYSTWSMTGDSLLGPWDVSRAKPFVAEPELFAAPLVRQRDGSWAFVGFRNLEPEGVLSFEIIDPVPVHLEDGGLVADASYRPTPPHPLRPRP